MLISSRAVSAGAEAYLQIFRHWNPARLICFSGGRLVFLCTAGVWPWYRRGIQWEIMLILMNYCWAFWLNCQMKLLF